jgi:hypothetical protein
LRVYERGLLAALDRIVAAVPPEDLAIQWDICQEVLVFENYFPERPADYKERILAELGRLGDAGPAMVETAIISVTARRSTSMSSSPRTWRSWSR